MMRLYARLSAVLLAPALLAIAQPATEGPNPYRTVEGSLRLPPGRTWGATSAVDVDRDGRSIWVAERCGANSCAGSALDPVLKFDASGALVSSFGAGLFVFPHGIHVDREGNIWVTDGHAADAQELTAFPAARGRGHQVFKFSPEGRLLLTIGAGGIAGDPPQALTEPNDVAIAPGGDIFIVEGHVGQVPSTGREPVARVSKFSKEGAFITTFGRFGSAPGEFRTPHALTFDVTGRLVVADRGNGRLQMFDLSGKFLEERRQFSRLSGIYIDRNDTLYGADSDSSTENHPGWRRGIRIGPLRDGRIESFILALSQSGATSGAEGVAVDADGNIYGAEVAAKRITKYVKKPLN